MKLSEAARSLWGKSDRETERGVWHSLVHHLLDVTACAEAIFARRGSS